MTRLEILTWIKLSEKMVERTEKNSTLTADNSVCIMVLKTLIREYKKELGV